MDNTPQIVDVPVSDPMDDLGGETPSAEESLRHFTADFDVAGIVRRLNNSNFRVPSFNPAPETGANYAGFQRNYIWSKKQKDRFIESLLLGYPVPGIFLVEQPGKDYLVLDGQQRLRTLQDFINGTDTTTEKAFRLNHVSEEGPFHGKLFAELSEPDQNLLQNTFIQVTVVVPRVAGHLQGVYQLFERINSGGTNLQPQEIRIALYAGPRVDGIRAMNEDPNWRALFGNRHSRLKDTELILRYLALREVALRYALVDWVRDAPRDWLENLAEPSALERQQVYKAPLNQFLNGYLEALGPEGTPSVESRRAFEKSCSALKPLGRAALRLDDSAQINAAHADAVLVGLSLSNFATTSEVDPATITADLSARLTLLESDDDYQKAVRESTSHLASVHKRLELATKALKDL